MSVSGQTELLNGVMLALCDPNEHNYSGGWANVLCLDSLKVVKFFNRGVWTDRSE